MLLLLALLELGKVDSKVVLFQLMLASESDPVELPRVVAPLTLDHIVWLLNVAVNHFAI